MPVRQTYSSSKFIFRFPDFNTSVQYEKCGALHLNLRSLKLSLRSLKLNLWSLKLSLRSLKLSLQSLKFNLRSLILNIKALHPELKDSLLVIKIPFPLL